MLHDAPVTSNHRLQHRAPVVGTMHVAWPQRTSLDIAELVEHEEWVVAGPPRDWGCGSKRVLSGSLIGERRQRGLDREAGKHRGRGRRTQHGGHADRPT